MTALTTDHALDNISTSGSTSNCDDALFGGSRDIAFEGPVASVLPQVDYYKGPKYYIPDVNNPVSRRSIDRPGFSNSGVDLYEGTESAEYFEVQNPWFHARDNGNFAKCDKYAITHAGGGDDYVNGSSAVDYIFGEAGNDILDGGHGDDRLNGGRDNDLLTGGYGEDVFVMEKGGGHDVVTDFSWYEFDKIDLDLVFENSGKAFITEYLSNDGFDTFIQSGDTSMRFVGARGWQVYDSVIENDNLDLVATNFQTLQSDSSLLGSADIPSDEHLSSGGLIVEAVMVDSLA